MLPNNDEWRKWRKVRTLVLFWQSLLTGSEPDPTQWIPFEAGYQVQRHPISGVQSCDATDGG